MRSWDQPVPARPPACPPSGRPRPLLDAGIGDAFAGAGDGLGELAGGDACCGLCEAGFDNCGECGECGDCPDCGDCGGDCVIS